MTDASSPPATSQVQEKAEETAQKAQGMLRDQINERSTKAGEQISSTANDLRSVGDELRNQGKDTPAKLADNAAERTERLGSYLAEADSDRILSDVEDFGRRQPWVVIAGGVALGLVASRFLKASSSRRYETRTGYSQASSARLPARTTYEPPPARTYDQPPTTYVTS